MNKTYYSLGLMSGTSGDGVDSSVIISDGRDQMVTKYNNYDLYPSYLSEEIHKIKEKIKISNDLSKYSSEINLLEDKLTNFHAIVANKWLKRIKIDIIGFHGQTIFHNSNEKLSKQLGLGKKLSDLTKTTVVYNFRQNDLKNGGEGAPLAAIYHKLIVMKLVKKRKMKVPAIILNIGGISNITTINKNYEITSEDIGPGNCLIDKWIRENSNKNFDKFGNTAKNGKIDKFILQQSLHSYFNSKIFQKKSLDTNDFNISFYKNLSLENGAATITEFTARILSKKFLSNDIYVCGGGRKNKFLFNLIKKKIKNKIKKIDDLGIDGDFIESQAFAYMAIRTYLNLPISFPETTGCKKPCVGGTVVKNF